MHDNWALKKPIQIHWGKVEFMFSYIVMLLDLIWVILCPTLPVFILFSVCWAEQISLRIFQEIGLKPKFVDWIWHLQISQKFSSNQNKIECAY